MTWIVRSQPSLYWGGLDLLLGIRNPNGSLDAVEPFVFKNYVHGSYIERTVTSSTSGIDGKDFLQACVDHAAEIGVFPSKLIAPTREIDAVRYHLEDMRRLVWPHLDQPKEKQP